VERHYNRKFCRIHPEANNVLGKGNELALLVLGKGAQCLALADVRPGKPGVLCVDQKIR